MARKAKTQRKGTVGESVKKRTPRKDEEKEWDSDALDDVSELESGGSKRKRAEKSLKKARAAKRTKAQESDSELELDEDQEVVGVVVKAPTTGQVPPGQISKNTLDFLTNLKDPECNDREWCVPGCFRFFALNSGY